MKSAHVWTGDATSGLRYILELLVGSVVDFDHTHGQIVLYAWDWSVYDNSPDSFVEVALYQVDGDQTAPTVTCSVSPAQLWPPNHKFVPVTVSVTVADAESGPAGFTLLSAVSNEPDNGLGDGDQPNDILGPFSNL